jgi:hypothetical protein
MNILDKIYYFIYCTANDIDEDYARIKGIAFTPRYRRAKIWFATTLIIYLTAFFRYTGLLYRFFPTGDDVSKFFVGLVISIMSITFIYFSSKEKNIVEYYRNKRSDRTFQDGRLGLIIVFGSIVLIITLEIVKGVLRS